MKVNVCMPKSSSLITTIEERISDWLRQKRMIARMKRFVKKCKGQSFPVELTTQELQEAEILIVKMIQEKYLSEEIARLKAGKQPKSTAIAKLQPIFDEHDVLRVGGRISTSNLEERVKHPVILPKKGSERIVEWHHRNIQH